MPLMPLITFSFKSTFFLFLFLQKNHQNNHHHHHHHHHHHPTQQTQIKEVHHGSPTTSQHVIISPVAPSLYSSGKSNDPI